MKLYSYFIAKFIFIIHRVLWLIEIQNCMWVSPCQPWYYRCTRSLACHSSFRTTAYVSHHLCESSFATTSSTCIQWLSTRVLPYRISVIHKDCNPCLSMMDVHSEKLLYGSSIRNSYSNSGGRWPNPARQAASIRCHMRHYVMHRTHLPKIPIFRTSETSFNHRIDMQ